MAGSFCKGNTAVYHPFLGLVVPLADAGISVFAISTFDTDYLMVQEAAWERAMEVLKNAGHSLRRAGKGEQEGARWEDGR